MYALFGYHEEMGEDTRYFTDNEQDTAFAIAERWYALRRYPVMYHYGDTPKVVFSWRPSQRQAA